MADCPICGAPLLVVVDSRAFDAESEKRRRHWRDLEADALLREAENGPRVQNETQPTEANGP